MYVRLLLIILLFLCAPFVHAAEAPLADPNTEDQPQEDAAASGNPAQAPIDEAWELVWSGQREMVSDIRETALNLSDDFAARTLNLSRELQPFEEEGRRLLVFANTFQGYPNAMEAVSRRISATISALDHVLSPFTMARREAEGLLERINQMSASLPDAADRARLSDEMKSYVEQITRVRFRLTAVLAQFDSLLPSLELSRQLEKKHQEINSQLPGLWKSFYLQKPLAWLSPMLWQQQESMLYYSWQAMLLRLPVELPTTTPEWSNAILRFCIGMLFAGTLLLISRKRLLHRGASPASLHIFNVSLPRIALGFAMLGSAVSASGEYFRVFLALGSLCMIWGGIYLSWDLRRLRLPGNEPARPPFLKLAPLAFCAYAILYLPLTQPICLVLWGIFLTLTIFRNRKWKLPPAGGLQLETGALDCFIIILWICLFLAMVGLHICSMVLYLSYVSISVALEFCLGGMSIVNQVNAHLPREGARAILAHLLVALAAPLVLVLAVAAVCLWVAMLPGGAYLLGEYALRGVTVGATQFNIIQALLIISMFYLTRAVVSMGTRFLSKLPRQNLHFDATLITPLSTAFTYLTWALFGLFVLRALGMELSSLAMVAGGLSVGIGFGMQTIVNNFLSGLILIFSRTLQVGDVVEAGGTTGRVRKISIRATMVETYDNAIIYVPNSEFMSGKLTNWTSFTRSVRKEVQVGVAYGSDTGQVVELLLATAKEHPNVLQFPAPSVNFADFAASSLDFRLRFWVRDYEQGAGTCSDLRMAIDRVFAEHRIEIAFPQLDLHVRDMPKAICSAPAKKRATLPARLIKPAGRIRRPAMRSAANRSRATKNPEVGKKAGALSQ